MAKKIKLSQMNFFLEKQLIKLSCTYFPLSFCKNLNKFLEPIQNYEDVKNDYEDVQNDTFVLNNFFLVQTIIITFIYLLAFSIVQNFKKFLQRIKSYEDVPFLGPHLPQTNIFWKIINIVVLYLLALFRRPVNEPCFVHSCLSTCQNSKLDIDLRVNYWWLKNTEISLAESHFWL